MREEVGNFHFGRLHAAPLRRFPGRFLLEFMREGDEEQHFDMTLDECRALRDWLNTFVDNRLPQQESL